MDKGKVGFASKEICEKADWPQLYDQINVKRFVDPKRRKFFSDWQFTCLQIKV